MENAKFYEDIGKPCPYSLRVQQWGHGIERREPSASTSKHFFLHVFDFFMHLLQSSFKESAHWDEEARGETEVGDWNSELSDCTSYFLDFIVYDGAKWSLTT